MEADVLLVGGGVASARCARTLRRNGFGGSVLLVGDETVPPYNRPPLSKELLRDGHPPELLAAEPPGWYERHDVQLLTGVAVTRLEPDERRATLADGRVGLVRTLRTGDRRRRRARFRCPAGQGALLLRTLGDAQRPAGGGTRGSCRARRSWWSAAGSSASRWPPDWLRWASRPRSWSSASCCGVEPWAGCSPRGRCERLREAGVTVRLGAAVTALDEGGARIGEEHLPGTFVVAGIGVRPRDELAAEAGLEVAGGWSSTPNSGRATPRSGRSATWRAWPGARESTGTRRGSPASVPRSRSSAAGSAASRRVDLHRGGGSRGRRLRRGRDKRRRALDRRRRGDRADARSSARRSSSSSAAPSRRKRPETSSSRAPRRRRLRAAVGPRFV